MPGVPHPLMLCPGWQIQKRLALYRVEMDQPFARQRSNSLFNLLKFDLSEGEQGGFQDFGSRIDHAVVINIHDQPVIKHFLEPVQLVYALARADALL